MNSLQPLTLVLLGNEASGKTTLASLYFEKTLESSNPISSYDCKIPIGKKILPMTLLDVNGSHFDTFSSNVHEMKDSILLYCFDLFNKSNLAKLKDKIDKRKSKHIKSFLIGTKLDKLIEEKDAQNTLKEISRDIEEFVHEHQFLGSYLMSDDVKRVQEIVKEVIKAHIHGTLYHQTLIDFAMTDISPDFEFRSKDISMPCHKCLVASSPILWTSSRDVSFLEVDKDEMESLMTVMQYLYTGIHESDKDLNNSLGSWDMLIPNESSRLGQIFDAFSKNRDQSRPLLYNYYNIDSKHSELVDSVIFDRFSHEALSKLDILALFDLYTIIKAPKDLYNVIIWITFKITPFNVEDIIPKVQSLKITSKILIERCILFYKMLQLTARVHNSMQK